MKLVEKGKNFVKKHKKVFIAGGVLVTTGVATFVISKDIKSMIKHEKEGQEILHVLRSTLKGGLTEAQAKIDEEIFSDLAPEIEQMVLDKGIEHAVIERYYDLGEDRLFKSVVVTIKQYAGD